MLRLSMCFKFLNSSSGELVLDNVTMYILFVIYIHFDTPPFDVLYYTIYCKTLIFSEPFNLAKLAIEIKTKNKGRQNKII